MCYTSDLITGISVDSTFTGSVSLELISRSIFSNNSCVFEHSNKNI